MEPINVKEMITAELKSRMADMKAEFRAKKCNVSQAWLDLYNAIERELCNRKEIAPAFYSE